MEKTLNEMEKRELILEKEDSSKEETQKEKK